jgi:hypothetical protein
VVSGFIAGIILHTLGQYLLKPLTKRELKPMSVLSKPTGVAIALAAASLMGCAGMNSSETTASASSDVQCYGVNKCKGFNDCKTATNACKGHGSCKGQGFIKMPAGACDQVGGTQKS